MPNKTRKRSQKKRSDKSKSKRRSKSKRVGRKRKFSMYSITKSPGPSLGHSTVYRRTKPSSGMSYDLLKTRRSAVGHLRSRFSPQLRFSMSPINNYRFGSPYVKKNPIFPYTVGPTRTIRSFLPISSKPRSIGTPQTVGFKTSGVRRIRKQYGLVGSPIGKRHGTNKTSLKFSSKRNRKSKKRKSKRKKRKSKRKSKRKVRSKMSSKKNGKLKRKRKSKKRKSKRKSKKRKSKSKRRRMSAKKSKCNCGCK